MAEKTNKRDCIIAGLRSHRAAARMNQRELAKKIDANPATVSAWENRGGISLEDAWVTADLYGVSLDDLVGRKVPS